MKQRITVEQLQELTEEQKKKLREWWKPQLYDVFCFFLYDGEKIIGCIERVSYMPDPESYPLLSIGQMIEFLYDHTNDFGIHYNDTGVIFTTYLSWSINEADGRKFSEEELADSLWEAIKAVL